MSKVIENDCGNYEYCGETYRYDNSYNKLYVEVDGVFVFCANNPYKMSVPKLIKYVNE
jgi:hypothetical protein